MNRIQLQVELNPRDVARALKTLRTASGLTQVDTAALLTVFPNTLQAREERGLNRIEDIRNHLEILGYKAVIVITNKETNNGNVRAGDGLRRTTA